MKGLIAAAVATAGLVVCLSPATALAQTARTDVILAGSESDVDYHAEAAPARPAEGGATIIGGNIQIVSERGARGGDAGQCDPDPRFGTHPRPEDDGCDWAEPEGEGEDFIAFGRHIQNDLPEDSGDLPLDTDTSPNGAFVPMGTQTRESFNGRGGLDRDGMLFMDDRPVLDDEDLNFRIRGTKTYAYLAPQGNADNRWRRLCGEGVVEELSNNYPMAEPFAIGQYRPFVVQVWDADWKDPSDDEGGNQDYFVIDVYPEGTTFDVESCKPKKAPPPYYPPPVQPPATPPVTPPAPPAVTPPAPQQAVAAAVASRRRGTASINGARACPVRAIPVRVRGRLIRRVTFYVDGRRVGTVSQAADARAFQIRVDPRRLRPGTHRVRAFVQFQPGAGPSRSVRMTFRVCARPVQRVQPQFTG